MTGACSYAHCDAAATHTDGAPGFDVVWPFCDDHYLEHRALFHGAAWPHNRRDPATKWIDQAPHGTMAAVKRHVRAGEPPCEACRSELNVVRLEVDRRRRERQRIVRVAS